MLHFRIEKCLRGAQDARKHLHQPSGLPKLTFEPSAAGVPDASLIFDTCR